jgi:tRNA G37 N-methylase TrmD
LNVKQFDVQQFRRKQNAYRTKTFRKELCHVQKGPAMQGRVRSVDSSYSDDDPQKGR